MKPKERNAKLKNINKQIQKIDKLLSPLYKQRDDINEEISFENNQKMIGKCFKFRNSYGSGGDWWFYIQVLGINSEGYLVCISAEHCSDNKIQIEQSIRYSSSFSKEYLPITEEEFEKAFEKILEDLWRII